VEPQPRLIRKRGISVEDQKNDTDPRVQYREAIKALGSRKVGQAAAKADLLRAIEAEERPLADNLAPLFRAKDLAMRLMALRDHLQGLDNHGRLESELLQGDLPGISKALAEAERELADEIERHKEDLATFLFWQEERRALR
jgi:hypothetical protein